MSDKPDNVVPLKLVPAPIKDGKPSPAAVIELLQRVLSDALAGQVHAVTIAYVDENGLGRSRLAAETHDQVTRLNAEMSYLTYQLNEARSKYSR